MLVGSYAAVFTGKRRVAIPKKFRKILGKSFIVAKWYESCLVLVSLENWFALLKRVTGEARIVTQPVRDTERFIVGSAFELEPDEQGRVVLPEALTLYAGLAEEVIFIGLGDRVEIWNQARWKEREDYVAKFADQFIEKLAEKDGK